MFPLKEKMNRKSFIILSLAAVITNTLPQFFSLGIGFGSDDSPLTFHTPDSPEPDAPSFQLQQPSFQSQQSEAQSQQSSFQPQQSSFAPQQSSFLPQKSSVQRQQSSFQPQQASFQQQSFQSNRVTAAPPPARSAPAPPFFNRQSNQQAKSFRQPVSEQRVFAIPTQPSVPQVRQNSPQQLQQKEQPQNNADSHQAALERNALHRQQLAKVIEDHNKKTFPQSDDRLRETDKEDPVDNNIQSQAFLTSTRRVPIPAKRPVEVAHFLGKPTPPTRVTNVVKQKLPDSIRDDILAHLDLINSLDKQVNELVVKAAIVFSASEETALEKRKPYEEERRNKVKVYVEDEVVEYETETD